MNPAHWFNAQSFHQHAPQPRTQPTESLGSWSSWDAERGCWRHYYKTAEGEVVETDEIGVPL